MEVDAGFCPLGAVAAYRACLVAFDLGVGVSEG